MPEPSSNYLAALAQLTEKVAVELVYAALGRDDGLLPINSPFSQPLRLYEHLDVNALVKLRGTQSPAKAA